MDDLEEAARNRALSALKDLIAAAIKNEDGQAFQRAALYAQAAADIEHGLTKGREDYIAQVMPMIQRLFAQYTGALQPDA